MMFTIAASNVKSIVAVRCGTWRIQTMTDTVDPRPGFYYVSIQNDAGQRRLVKGPWPSHREALDAFSDVKLAAERVDPRACWYAWGTARAETDLGPGLLGAPAGYDGPLMANVR